MWLLISLFADAADWNSTFRLDTLTWTRSTSLCTSEAIILQWLESNRLSQISTKEENIFRHKLDNSSLISLISAAKFSTSKSISGSFPLVWKPPTSSVLASSTEPVASGSLPQSFKDFDLFFYSQVFLNQLLLKDLRSSSKLFEGALGHNLRSNESLSTKFVYQKHFRLEPFKPLLNCPWSVKPFLITMWHNRQFLLESL